MKRNQIKLLPGPFLSYIVDGLSVVAWWTVLDCCRDVEMKLETWRRRSGSEQEERSQNTRSFMSRSNLAFIVSLYLNYLFVKSTLNEPSNTITLCNNNDAASLSSPFCCIIPTPLGQLIGVLSHESSFSFNGPFIPCSFLLWLTCASLVLIWTSFFHCFLSHITVDIHVSSSSWNNKATASIVRISSLVFFIVFESHHILLLSWCSNKYASLSSLLLENTHHTWISRSASFICIFHSYI